MHEVGIMQNALSAALAQARAQGATRIHGLRMRVGALSGVVTDSLRFAFECLARGTAAEGAELVIESIPVSCRCRSCSHEFLSPDFSTECPRCHTADVTICSGREIELASVEVS